MTTSSFFLFFFGQFSVSLSPGCPAKPGYDPHALFAPGFYGDLHLATRAASGAPSASYWQNRADYTLAVKLDTVANSISGRISSTIRITVPTAFLACGSTWSSRPIARTPARITIPGLRRTGIRTVTSWRSVKVREGGHFDGRRHRHHRYPAADPVEACPAGSWRPDHH